MDTGAYAFLLFSGPEHLVPAIDAARALPAVRSWHAVDGHYHLVLTLAEADDAVRAALEALPGVAELLYCPVETEVTGGFTPDPELCHAFLTMEIDEARRAEVGQALQDMQPIRFGALAFGACGCVAALSGPSFEAVDAVVEKHIRPIDGVLRVKRDWIIDLTQL
ncbi:MAG: hypothetical protein KFF77_00780 [Bacteroidetes bacterium]|nr:hypothetical protein [Bacteroidota bacterium]